MPSGGCAQLSLPSSLVLGVQGAVPAPVGKASQPYLEDWGVASVLLLSK